MDQLTPDPEAIEKIETTPEVQDSGKDAWVTPVVREFDPAEVTNAFFSGTGTDTGIYS